ncbi:MAG: hypothetical protein ACD_37C00282G0003 [uncultured bacterium]|nr:MAG: hypothetical protein ACD_37C00282G0003 [uncultured bacterium]
MNNKLKSDSKLLEQHADEIRRMIITMAYNAKSAHMGGALSCVELLTVLYFQIMRVNPKKPQDDKRDYLIFSKAHDSKALYAVLAEKGYFDKEILSSYEANNGLPGHTTRNVVPGVEASAGSLGHGLSIGVGLAYAKKIDKSKQRVFVMLSDGECDEGSNWEAMLFAGHQKLKNLIAIVDYNKLQGFGRTDEILTLEPFAEKWKNFGWGVNEVDGHDIEKIIKSLVNIPFENNKPSVLIAHTIKGYKGIPKYVDQVASQYKPPTEEEYKNAMEDLK